MFGGMRNNKEINSGWRRADKERMVGGEIRELAGQFL